MGLVPSLGVRPRVSPSHENGAGGARAGGAPARVRWVRQGSSLSPPCGRQCRTPPTASSLTSNDRKRSNRGDFLYKCRFSRRPPSAASSRCSRSPNHHRGAEDPRVHRPGADVPWVVQHAVDWDRAHARQALARLPVRGGDRQAPQDDAGVALRPIVQQASPQGREIETPERDVEQQRLERLLVGRLEHPPAGRGGPEEALAPAEQPAGLAQLPQQEQREEVRLVDRLVEPERLGPVEPRPVEQVAHPRHDGPRQVAGRLQPQPGPRYRGPEQQQRVASDRRSPEFVLR
jgi:hypothetical protein